MQIYKITNLVNGKIYVGQTKKSIEQRFLQHQRANSPLGQAMRQFGIDNFTIEVIERCENQEQLNEREIFWIKALNSKIPIGYNVADGGRGFVRLKLKKPRISVAKFSAAKKMTIADSLKRFRKDFNLSQTQVADVLAIHQQAYGRYELNKNIPSASIIVKLANEFDVSADYLLGLTDKPQSPKITDADLKLLQALHTLIESNKNQSA